MEHLLRVGLVLLLAGSGVASAQQEVGYQNDSTGRGAEQPLGPGAAQQQGEPEYTATLNRLTQGDMTVDLRAFRVAGALKSGQNASVIETGERLSFRRLAASGDWAGALDSAKRALERNYASPIAHFDAMSAYGALHQTDEAAAHEKLLNALLASIGQSGDGKSPATAYFVVTVQEEYIFLRRVLQLQATAQAWVKQGGHFYDRLLVPGTDNNQPQYLWFNADFDAHSDPAAIGAVKDGVLATATAVGAEKNTTAAPPGSQHQPDQRVPGAGVLDKLPAIYVNTQTPADQLQLNADYTLSLQEAGQTYHGTFKLNGNKLEIDIDPDTKTTASIDGDKLTDSSGQTWVLKEQPAAPAMTAAAGIMNNQDVIQLAKAGLDDSIILVKIASSKCQFDTSTDALIQLKNSGVSAAVIKVMAGGGQQQERAATAGGAAVPVPTAVAGAPQANVEHQLPDTPAPATTVSFHRAINNVAADYSGNLYFSYYNCVWRVDAAGTLTRVAGKSELAGYSGDGGPALRAELSRPDGVAADAAGNIYVADNGNSVIRKITADGTISTVAGNGSRGYTGDGGPATSAQLYHPIAVTLDSRGNLYVLDSVNGVIRKVSASGTITTVAGIMRELLTGSGAAGLPLGPTAIAVDGAGNLCVATYNRVYKVGTQGTVIILAGNGSSSNSNAIGDDGPAGDAQLSSASGLTFDSAGNLYIADTNHSRVRKVDLSGAITTVAGNGNRGFSGDEGLATNAQFQVPRGLSVDGAGNLYIADSQARIRRVGNRSV